MATFCLPETSRRITIIRSAAGCSESAEKTVKREVLEETGVVYAERRNFKAIV